MKTRLLPLVEIRCTADHCGRCMYLQPGPRIPRCGLFTGALDTDGKGRPFRADECKDAQARAVGQ